MNYIIIRRPNKNDIEELHSLFTVTINDAFKIEGVGNDLEGINSEINNKMQSLREDFDSNGSKRFFLIACYDGKIVGTIAYGPSSELVNKCTNGKLKDVIEIGTVYVLPEYQKKGIGMHLLNSMYTVLLSRNIEEFCLDSGYGRAQKIWSKKIGEPNFIIKDYWGEGGDHMIWHRKLDDISIVYSI